MVAIRIGARLRLRRLGRAKAAKTPTPTASGPAVGATPDITPPTSPII
jgi:hypothetical protein